LSLNQIWVYILLKIFLVLIIEITFSCQSIFFIINKKSIFHMPISQGFSVDKGDIKNNLQYTLTAKTIFGDSTKSFTTCCGLCSLTNNEMCLKKKNFYGSVAQKQVARPSYYMLMQIFNFKPFCLFVQTIKALFNNQMTARCHINW